MHAAKKAGIEIVHGFFVVGNPGRDRGGHARDVRLRVEAAARHFGFNRLCVYRGTPLWQEYVERGLVNDATDWYKYFKCSSIDPTCLPGEKIHRIRSRELRKLILYKFIHFPMQTFPLPAGSSATCPSRRRLLLVKPFLGKKSGATKAEVISRAVEHGTPRAPRPT